MTDAAALQAQFQQALALHQQGELARAADIYRQILVHLPNHADTLFLLGIVSSQMQNFTDAATFLGRVVAINPAHADAWINHGAVLLSLGQYQGTVDSLDKAAQLQPANADIYNNRAIALRALGRHVEALASYDRGLALQPQSAEFLNNRAVTLSDLERHDEAAESCAKAIALKPDYAAAHNNRGIALNKLHRYDEALISFGNVIALSPNDPEAYNNRGFTYADMKRYPEALADYAKAHNLNPRYAEPYNNRAICLAEMRDYESALAAYRQAVALKPDYADAHVNLGHLLGDMKRFDEAVASYRTAYQLKPHTDFLHGHLVYTRMMNCDWQGIESDIAVLAQRMARGDRATSPFPALALTDDPALQHKAVDAWTKAKHSRAAVPASVKSRGDKIRVGYFSMDFRDHPVSMLTAGLFEAHDRNQFEITAFSYGPDRDDAMRARLQRGFDHFIDVRAKTDAAIAALAHDMGIDIAVDLAGYTKDARTGIFALRAAPAQVSYLGFPGTMAAPFMDYIVADDVAIPPAVRSHYAEKVVALPVFQVNDDKRERPKTALTRAELGLPPTGFVFCCFNNTYKFSPQVFAAWMRILKRTPGSVLFLYADSDTATANLQHAAAVHGIGSDRLIFGRRLGMAQYLARYRAADLFLDTLPYNAGTTTADALWMDLPVLTCTGGAFASRMAASLLHAMDLPELITHSLLEYEERAVALATDTGAFTALKQKVAHNRVTSPLFNTTAFTRTLEDAYRQITARTRAGLPPDHIIVK